jgi:hypothetical protein
MRNEGMQPREIRVAIDQRYAAQIDMATPTPYPPSDLKWA